MSINSESQLNRKYMEFIKLLNIYLNHFPKYEKYSLAQRIRDTSYDLYDYITEAQKRYFKKTTLTLLDITHEKLRMQIYLAYELGYFKFKDGKNDSNNTIEGHRIQAITVLIDEIGKMIGGWIKKIKSQNNW